MNKMRFVIVGSGWRSLFYVRIAKALPERFELCALLCRTQEKADSLAKEYGIRTSISVDECRAMKPDFVVVAVNKSSIYSVSCEWLDYGFPVICETPPSDDTDELIDLWERSQKGARLQVAEQYFLYPTYACRLDAIADNKLGRRLSLSISTVHDYHSASLIRKFLGSGMQSFAICGKEHEFMVTETDSRYGLVFDGVEKPSQQKHLTIEFSGGTVAFHDFASEQYHSTIRHRFFNLRGSRGEMVDNMLYYLDEQNHVQTLDLTPVIEQRCEAGFLGAHGMSEDETAIATIMDDMENYIKNGTSIYPLAEGLQDAYMSILMHQAVKTPGRLIQSAKMPWQS